MEAGDEPRMLGDERSGPWETGTGTFMEREEAPPRRAMQDLSHWDEWGLSLARHWTGGHSSPEAYPISFGQRKKAEMGLPVGPYGRGGSVERRSDVPLKRHGKAGFRRNRPHDPYEQRARFLEPTS